MAWTYILRCRDDSLYVGSTRDLDERMAQHHAGFADAYTSTRRPITLVWAGEFDRIDEAYVMERRIKGWRRKKRIALIEGRYGDLRRLSVSGSHDPRPKANHDGVRLVYRDLSAE